MSRSTDTRSALSENLCIGPTTNSVCLAMFFRPEWSRSDYSISVIPRQLQTVTSTDERPEGTSKCQWPLIRVDPISRLALAVVLQSSGFTFALLDLTSCLQLISYRGPSLRKARQNSADCAVAKPSSGEGKKKIAFSLLAQGNPSP